MVDVYVPNHVTVSNSSSTNFDGSASSTNAAIIVGLAADFDAEIYYEASDDGGSTWTQIAQLRDNGGNSTFTADWHSQGNRLMVESSNRRVRIKNVSSSSGVVAVDGDEI